jgi:hypothetical protein
VFVLVAAAFAAWAIIRYGTAAIAGVTVVILVALYELQDRHDV